MEILTLVAVPLITSLLAPVVLEYVRKKINQRKEEAELRRSEFNAGLEADKHNDLMAAELRKELRDENISLKTRNTELEKVATQVFTATAERDAWEKKFYAVKKEKQNLEFELTLVKQELEHIRRQYEQYIEVRDRAERHVRDSGDNAG